MPVAPRTPATRASTRNKAPATAPPASTKTRKVAPHLAPPTVQKPIQSNEHAVDDNDGLLITLNEELQPIPEDRQPLKAYLRIRPSPVNPAHPPYLTAQSNTTVLATPPSTLVRSTRLATSYTFTQVFPSTTSQSAFFSHTALPLVQNLLSGENGLLFAYGVSGAGKTWTIQGGKNDGEQGVVWRALRAVMSSVRGHQGDVGLRMAGKAVTTDDGARESLGSGVDAEELEDATVVKVDRNYSYSVFVSYAEIYNEKIFDLLDPSATSSSGKRRALALKSDPTGGKYIHGLREVRVRSAGVRTSIQSTDKFVHAANKEAHAAFATGLLARQVSGTKINHSSSRSHAIFSVRVVRIHKGRPNDPDSLSSARLSIVDLAGSERTKATLATGDRLKETGSINKSLMVLGQCMEVLRTNQRRLAAAGSQGGGVVKLGVVPFRHSKLTELFQEFFIGEGRAVMIVNVNPHDGGYDEIVNVMRFSALAREIRTGPTYSGTFGTGRHVPKMMPEDVEERLPLQGVIIEEEESDDAEPEDPLVTHLFEQLEDMRLKLYDAEMRCAVIEGETREEVTREMEGRMRAMERMFNERIMFDAEQNEAKIDSKIDLVNRVMQASLADAREHEDDRARSTSTTADIIRDAGVPNILLAEENETIGGNEEEEENEVDSLIDEAEVEPSDDSDDSFSDEEDAEDAEPELESEEEWKPGHEDDDESPTSVASTPVKAKGKRRSSARPSKSITASSSKLSSVSCPPKSIATAGGPKPLSSEGPQHVALAEDKENVHPAPPAPNALRTNLVTTKVETMEPSLNAGVDTMQEVMSPVPAAKSRGAGPSRTAAKAAEVRQIKVEEPEMSMIIPDKKARAGAVAIAGEGAVYIPGEGEPDFAKKKKRKLQSKTAIVTEEQILEIERGVQSNGHKDPGNVRRATRAAR